MPCENVCAPAEPSAGFEGWDRGAATRRLSGANQTGRLFSSAACRLGEKIPARLAPIGACAQAASEAADKATASHRTRRPPARVSHGAPDLIAGAPTSKPKVVPRLMGGICYISSLPAGKIPQGKAGVMSTEPWPDHFRAAAPVFRCRGFARKLWRGMGALVLHAFASREPVPTSLENTSAHASCHARG
jgi:hypothetical protein